MRYVSQGTSIAPEMRASTWNAFIDAAIANRMSGGQTSRTVPRNLEHLVRVRNATGGVVTQGSVMGVGGPAISPNDNARKFERDPIIEGETPSASYFGKFVIATGLLQDGQIGWGQLDGLATVKIKDLTRPWNRADIDDTDPTQLELKPNGSAQLLWKIGSVNQSGLLSTIGGDNIITQGGDNLTDHSNQNYAMVRLGKHDYVTHTGKADSEISANSSGTVSLWHNGGDSGDDVTAHLDWMHGDEVVSSGKEVLVMWFPDESLWRIIGAECE